VVEGGNAVTRDEEQMAVIHVEEIAHLATVDEPESVLAWVLGFGRAAQVVEPEALRDAVQRELLAALEGYAKKK